MKSKSISFLKPPVIYGIVLFIAILAVGSYFIYQQSTQIQVLEQNVEQLEEKMLLEEQKDSEQTQDLSPEPTGVVMPDNTNTGLQQNGSMQNINNQNQGQDTNVVQEDIIQPTQVQDKIACQNEQYIRAQNECQQEYGVQLPSYVQDAATEAEYFNSMSEEEYQQYMNNYNLSGDCASQRIIEYQALCE